MTDHYKGHEFEALQLRYEDQVVLLRTLTEVDHRIVTAFFALQLALGGWLVTQDPLDSYLQWVISAMDLTVAFVFSILLRFNHLRRQEVANTIKNLNTALGFNEPGAYLVGKSLNPQYKRRYWFKWYIASVVVSTVALFLVVFRSSFAPLELRCDTTDSGAFGIRLEANRRVASLILDDGVVVGKALTFEDTYQLQFPASSGRWETHVAIARLTGAMSWEHGVTPFSSGSAKNVIRQGKCRRLETSEAL